MGRKKIQKAPKSAKKEQEQQEVEEVQEKKPARASKTKKAETPLFSDTFNNRISEFKNFYTQFINLKGADSSEEFDDVIKTVAGDLEEACAKVLQNNLVDANKWVDEQIIGIQNQIKSTSEAQSSTRAALEEANTFSGSEIEAQINLIREKGKKLSERLQVYQNMEKRIRQMCNEGGMEQQ